MDMVHGWVTKPGVWQVLLHCWLLERTLPISGRRKEGRPAHMFFNPKCGNNSSWYVQMASRPHSHHCSTMSVCPICPVVCHSLSVCAVPYVSTFCTLVVHPCQIFISKGVGIGLGGLGIEFVLRTWDLQGHVQRCFSTLDEVKSRGTSMLWCFAGFWLLTVVNYYWHLNDLTSDLIYIIYYIIYNYILLIYCRDQLWPVSTVWLLP